MLKKLYILCTLLLVFIPIWVYFIAPLLTKIPDDFYYEAEIFSIDNFYNEQAQEYAGSEISVTQYTFEVEKKTGDVILIKNIFDVRTINDDKIFAVERIYGINAHTGEHVANSGDRIRSGYLFAPRRLKLGEPYTYWHINYDSPAQLTFIEEEYIADLKVYRYESDYHADQTNELGHLTGVPEERGVNLDINLNVWVEPITGRLIKYEDKTTAYYYDSITKNRTHPWNSFHNRYSLSSVAEQIRLAKKEKTNMLIVERIIPITLVSLFCIFLVFLLILKRRNSTNV
jgi:hypothetical protein